MVAKIRLPVQANGVVGYHEQLLPTYGGDLSMLLDSLLQCENSGNGNCPLHAVAHSLGFMDKQTRVLDDNTNLLLRGMLADLLMRTLSLGQLRNVQQYDMQKNSRQSVALPPEQHHRIKDLANELGVDLSTVNGHGTRSSDALDYTLRNACRRWATSGQWLPVRALVLANSVAEFLQIRAPTSR